MTKKVLIDSRMYGLEHTGIGRYLMHLVSGLIAANKKYHYYIILKNKYYDKVKVPNNWTKIRLDAPYFTVREQIRLAMILDRLKPDLVHFPNINVPILYSGKFVVTVHDLTMYNQSSQATTLPKLVYYLKRIPFKIVFNYAVRQSSAIITPTNFVKNDLLKTFHVPQEKVTPTYEGIDNTFLAKTLDQKILSEIRIPKNYFVYNGNLYPHKNITRLIEAVVMLNNMTHNKVSLFIICPRNVFLERLKRKIIELNATPFVNISVFLPDNFLKIIYKYSLGLVYPSLAEGFGLQGLEAMASGTLVLASDIPVFREIYSDKAIYFNPYDFSSIANAMMQVINMKSATKKSLVSKSQRFVKKYSWNDMVKKTINVYESELNEKN